MLRCRQRKRVTPQAPKPTVERRSRLYVGVRWKFAISLMAAFAWATFSYLMARVWLGELSTLLTAAVAYLAVFGIAIIPGFMNAFLIASLVQDRRPRVLVPERGLPAISILVAAYNEAESIESTVASIAAQQYPGPLEVIVVNDGFTSGKSWIGCATRG